MADSSVPITAGSGTSVDTRTESVAGDHRQVMVIGDPVDGLRVVGVTADGSIVVEERSSVHLELILRELQRMSIYLAQLAGFEVKDADLPGGAG